MSQEVICVIKDDRRDIVSSIKEVGTNAVYLTQEEAIELIKRNPEALSVNLDGERTLLSVATSPSGLEYIRTENDDPSENRLLNLPYCRYRNQLFSDSADTRAPAC